jgi:hypothetical protein
MKQKKNNDNGAETTITNMEDAETTEEVKEASMVCA